MMFFKSVLTLSALLVLASAMTLERISRLPENDWRSRDADFKEPKLSHNLELVELLRKIGAAHGIEPGEVALAWVLHNPAVTAAIVGLRRADQVNGTAGVCQTVTVPAAATLTFWVYEGTTDTIKYVDQEADILSTSGSQIAQLYSEADTTNGWVEKSFSLGTYAGETVQLYFGVKGNGYSKDYVYEYLDDVSLTGSSATATPSAGPTATPTAKPTASPTAKPSAAPSTSPTATASPAPTASPSAAPYACNNTQFLNDQSEFAAGTITADQLVDICGSVTQVLAAKKTSSGDHGYFYVEMPSGYQIEIVSNLDAMAEAPTDDPPSTWPWVAVNDYVYVQGRYYYDSSSSQGVDWTEDDTDSSWSHVGYVVVCTSSGADCSKYW